MRTTLHTLVCSATVAAAIFTGVPKASAQMSTFKFNNLFATAFSDVLADDCGSALPILDKLHASDPGHGQVAYLLGMCMMRSGSSAHEAARVLAIAAERADGSHNPGSAADRSAPLRSHLLLGDALAALSKGERAKQEYRLYIAKAHQLSLRGKAEVISRIRAAEGLRADAGASNLSAMQP